MLLYILVYISRQILSRLRVAFPAGRDGKGLLFALALPILCISLVMLILKVCCSAAPHKDLTYDPAQNSE